MWCVGVKDLGAGNGTADFGAGDGNDNCADGRL